MGSFSIWHWMILLIISFIFVLPFWRITKRTGNPPIMSLMLFVPLLNVIFIFYLAFGQWPALDRRQ